ncbi:NF-kappa-B inhibitor-like protein [Parasponia andersonii]|uniref:NF-kappa-B inhibitor-like protein n=1 Tax=Parasponia andersonii TaxID=3476 RepID=A0A2P5CWH9_PARAD|nr:NF-kappa-B inhibitor-like protein [Parasponia andersonii]
MDTLQRFGCFTTSIKSPFSTTPSIPPRPHPWKSSTFILRTSLRPVSEIGEEEEDVLKTFLKERQLNGDLISKVSDMFWQKEAIKFLDSKDALSDTPQQPDQVMESDDDGGFLKLSRTQEWVLGDISAPINKKAVAKALQDDRERRKRLNLLKYEALKRELFLLSIGIGTACSGYCLIVLSGQAAVSYAAGVLFSCLYLQLLYRHVDSLSREVVPHIFRQKKTKKIGIRSEDVKDLFERSFKGIGIALSSPRLVIPAAIYGLWILSHQYFSSEFFDFQLVPAMLGMFVYKAAALVQVYRDNEDLQFIFPDNDEGSK